jgi:hypothetical protein
MRPIRRRRGVTQWALAVAGISMASVACTTSPIPGRVPDQQNVGPTAILDYVDAYTCNGASWTSEVAQTLVARHSGILDHLSLRARPSTDSSAPLVISIRPLRADGAPSDDVLGAGTYSGPGTPALSSEVFDVSLTEPVPVVAGERYAIVIGVASAVGCSTGTYGWYVEGTADTYASGVLSSRGNLYNRPDWVPDYGGANDLVFETWVNF